jgi:flagellar motility protein MotE (MotC chaperone)
MIRFIRDLRLVPIAVIASACLLVLKTADLVLDSGYLVAADNAPASDVDATLVHAAPDVLRPGEPPRSWAQKMFNFPDSSGGPAVGAGVAPPAIASAAIDKLNADITGSVATDGAPDKGATKAKDEAVSARKDTKDNKDAKDPKDPKDVKEQKEMKPPGGTVIPTEGAPPPSGAERAILERLQERRHELDARARELDIREGLIAAAEKRVEGKLTEMKQVDAQITADTVKKDEAEVARFKGLVTMYENMKPRDAAKIFDRLELGVLLEVASKINPRRMSDILALMSAETAERLTVEFASRAQSVAKGGSDLPKIEGRSTTP